MFAAMNQPQLLVSWRTLQEEVAKKIWDVEGIGGRLKPIFTVPGGITEKCLREWFPEQVLAMAEENEAGALSKEVRRTPVEEDVISQGKKIWASGRKQAITPTT